MRASPWPDDLWEYCSEMRDQGHTYEAIEGQLAKVAASTDRSSQEWQLAERLGLPPGVPMETTISRRVKTWRNKHQRELEAGRATNARLTDQLRGLARAWLEAVDEYLRLEFVRIWDDYLMSPDALLHHARTIVEDAGLSDRALAPEGDPNEWTLSQFLPAPPSVRRLPSFSSLQHVLAGDEIWVLWEEAVTSAVAFQRFAFPVVCGLVGHGIGWLGGLQAATHNRPSDVAAHWSLIAGDPAYRDALSEMARNIIWLYGARIVRRGLDDHDFLWASEGKHVLGRFILKKEDTLQRLDSPYWPQPLLYRLGVALGDEQTAFVEPQQVSELLCLWEASRAAWEAVRARLTSLIDGAAGAIAGVAD